MDSNTRTKMRSKARLVRGLMNILLDDVERIGNEVDDCDVVNLKDSLQDAKGTLQCVLDNIVELEYTVYLSDISARK